MQDAREARKTGPNAAPSGRASPRQDAPSRRSLPGRRASTPSNDRDDATSDARNLVRRPGEPDPRPEPITYEVPHSLRDDVGGGLWLDLDKAKITWHPGQMHARFSIGRGMSRAVAFMLAGVGAIGAVLVLSLRMGYGATLFAEERPVGVRILAWGAILLSVGAAYAFFTRSQAVIVDNHALKIRRGHRRWLIEHHAIAAVERGASYVGAKAVRKRWERIAAASATLLVAATTLFFALRTLVAGLGFHTFLLMLMALVFAGLAAIVYFWPDWRRRKVTNHFLRVRLHDGTRIPVASADEPPLLDRLERRIEEHIVLAMRSKTSGTTPTRPIQLRHGAEFGKSTLPRKETPPRAPPE